MAPTTRTMQDWLKVHKALMEAELKLADLASRTSTGQVTEAELAGQHQQVLALRALAQSVFETALVSLGRP
jgi:hypothetical protein